MGRHSSSMEYFSARTQASCPGKLIFCILAISFMNLIPELWNDIPQTTSQPQRKTLFPGKKYSQISSLLGRECCVLSLFPFPSPFTITCTQTVNFHYSPIHSQGATCIYYLWTANMKIPSNPRWGRNCLQMGCSRVRRGKQHLLLDTCLCMKGSLLDGFHCREFFLRQLLII